MTYLLTFVCYGSHLPRQEGIVDRNHNLPGHCVLERNPGRLAAAQRAMRQPGFTMTAATREIVLRAIREVCEHKGWLMLAAHVRTEHVHVVLDCECRPEVALTAFKSYASRTLNLVRNEHGRIRWARHGSTRYLWTSDEIDGAVRYVVAKQGEPMAVWQATPRALGQSGGLSAP